MHDPLTTAFQIPNPFARRYEWGDSWRDRPALLTIWHRDPEKDGTDDSCGWFKRARHGNPETLRKLTAEFDHAWDSKHSGWFDAEGRPRYSSLAITLGLFRTAAWVHFRDRRRIDRFMRRNLYLILSFAENPVDSLHPLLVGKYDIEPKERRVEEAVSIIYGCILRWEQRWWQHARWHVHHWRWQLHPWQHLRRRHWDKCSKCGKRGYPKGVSAIGDWSGNRIWHSTCDNSGVAEVKP